MYNEPHSDHYDDADVNWQTLQPPAADSPVPFMSQLCSFSSEQNDPETGPVRPVLLASERISRVGGKLGGRGKERLFESRWSSRSEDNDEIDGGITPERLVEERSLMISR